MDPSYARLLVVHTAALYWSAINAIEKPTICRSSLVVVAVFLGLQSELFQWDRGLPITVFIVDQVLVTGCLGVCIAFNLTFQTVVSLNKW